MDNLHWEHPPVANERDKRIIIEWDGYSGRTTVEWQFASQTSMQRS